MKLGIISDIHANLPALEIVLKNLEMEGCDRIYNLGDAIGIGSMPKECLDLLEDKKILNIMGNHDELFSHGLPPSPNKLIGENEYSHQIWTHSQLTQRNKEFAQRFNYEVVEEIEGVRILFTHFHRRNGEFSDFNPKGTNKSICEVFGQKGFDLVLFGHIHREIEEEIENTIFHNPSSVGCNTDPVTQFSIISIKNKKIDITKRTELIDDSEFIKRYRSLNIPASDEIDKYFLGGRIARG